MAANDGFDAPGFPAQNDTWLESQKPKGGGGGCMKGCLIGCGVIFLLGAIGAFVVYRNASVKFSEDPVASRAMLKEMIEAEPPQGYDAKFSMDATVFKFGMKMVAVAPGDVKVAAQNEIDETKSSVFMVFSIPGVNAENMQAQAQAQRKGKNQKQGAQEVVEVKVGGKTVSAVKTINEQDGKKIVQYMILLKPGVFMVAAGPEDKFDQKSLDTFLAGIKTE